MSYLNVNLLESAIGPKQLRQLSKNEKISLFIDLDNENKFQSKNLQIFHELLDEWKLAKKELFALWNSYEENSYKFVFYINYFQYLVLSLNNYNYQTLNGFDLFQVRVIEKLRANFKENAKYDELEISLITQRTSQLNTLLHTQLYNVISEFVSKINQYCALKNIRMQDVLTNEYLANWLFLKKIKEITNNSLVNDLVSGLPSKKVQQVIDFVEAKKAPAFSNLYKMKFSKEDDFWEEVIKTYQAVFSKIAKELVS